MFATIVRGLKLLLAMSEGIGRRLLDLAFAMVASAALDFVSTFSFVFILSSFFEYSMLPVG